MKKESEEQEEKGEEISSDEIAGFLRELENNPECYTKEGGTPTFKFPKDRKDLCVFTYSTNGSKESIVRIIYLLWKYEKEIKYMNLLDSAQPKELDPFVVSEVIKENNTLTIKYKKGYSHKVDIKERNNNWFKFTPNM